MLLLRIHGMAPANVNDYRSDADVITIGREPPNDLVLEHPHVSRAHAVIERTSLTGYTITDLGSTMGTFVNGKAVAKMAIVPNDVIVIGAFTMTMAIDY